MMHMPSQQRELLALMELMELMAFLELLSERVPRYQSDSLRRPSA